MKSLRILIIDDDVATCGLLKTVLELDNHQVITTNEIPHNDILALLEQGRPDFIIMDYHLGGSLEATPYIQTIRQAPFWQHIAILVMSAVDHTTDVTEAGANGFIPKPFDWQSITTQVNSISEQLFIR